ncbi:hypothetical protein QWI17_15465 [Gilvimarinus sp. SDUM040013]|uniref:Uncharacterized protein n=1 Tax=Gilvimarinus gilvus TaxID=3058038 RepID=A0ABU4S320_9GAMM|nr:hypothetical protein [Gilvimarinus sp. SDUM040013]MDO3387240.1 hypothetical protein [Gilvimarinus sp. SDUM040013]MDX6851405.1 hypothetical protein [Gilvimarinus sp. SDUM040013]
MIYSSNYGARWHLSCAQSMPRAYGRLVNKHRTMTVNCHGAAKVLTAKSATADSFARRFYLCDPDEGGIAVLPYGDGNTEPSMFDFSVGDGCLVWDTCYHEVDARLVVTLAQQDNVELWSVTLANRSAAARHIKLYPAFSFGQLRSKNNSAEYRPDLEGIVATSVVTQSHRGETECRIQQRFVLHEFPPVTWQCRQENFLGGKSWQHPQALDRAELDCDASHQWSEPMAAFHYDVDLAPGEAKTLRFMVGEGESKTAILKLRDRYLYPAGFARVLSDNQAIYRDTHQSIQLDSPEDAFNHFTNHWLAQQVLTAKADGLREKLANTLSLVFVDPAQARCNILQFLEEGRLNVTTPVSGFAQCCAELIMVIDAYQEETGDAALLRELIDVRRKRVSVFECLNTVVHGLVEQIDDRGLLDTRRGDEDGANWRSLRACASATFSGVFTLERWAVICEKVMLLQSLGKEYRAHCDSLRSAAVQYLWSGDWFAQGVSVRGKRQGEVASHEGRIHLKPQSWALLAGCGTLAQPIVASVDKHLKTEYGLLNLWPAYTKLDDEWASWLAWQPGCGLNASHLSSDSAQYAYALYEIGESERAFEVLHSVLPCLHQDDQEQGATRRLGVLPTYIPDYVTGPVEGDESWSGRASIAPSTFASGWVYLALERGLLGIRGTDKGLQINPQLPMAWYGLKAVKHIRGAILYLSIERDNTLAESQMWVDGELQKSHTIEKLEPGRRYQVEIALARSRSVALGLPRLVVGEA